MNEAHTTRYFVHLEADKIYYDLRGLYLWPGMKKDIATYVSKCLTCSKVKAEHQKPSGLLQHLEIPEWKWENITMDFISKLPRKNQLADYVLDFGFIVDRLTKSAHFLAIREDYKIERLARLYINEISLDLSVKCGIANLARVKGRKMYSGGVLSFGREKLFLGLTGCGFGDGAKMVLHCYKLLCKFSPYGDTTLRGWQHIPTTDKIVQIKERLKTARDRQKSYVDNRRKPLEFSVGDKVLLKVSPRKGVVCFGKRRKISPRYVGPFEIVERVGPVAYRLRLPQELVGVHDIFHVSNLKKCLADVTLHVPLEEVKIDEKLYFVEEPMEIMDREVKKLKKIRIPIVKVRWNSRRGPEFTWEREDEMKRKYPQLFVRCDLARSTEISGRNSL
ncbi:putative reverse transcriptase domain-containing protein [Tanacetum coccineum]